MRITIVHSYYTASSVSGENLAVDQQGQALAEAGHDVTLLSRRTDDLSSERGYSASAALRVATGLEIPRRQLPAADDAEHVLMVHNLFPNFGTRWIGHWPGPVVTMIHNFRYLCANGLFLRDGAVCTLCACGNTLSSVRHGCYRDSRVATAPLAIGNALPTRRVAPLTKATVVVTQSERARRAYAHAGVPPSRLLMIPGFTSIPQPPKEASRSRSWLFVGRLSEEKGLGPLLAEWPLDERLDVIGDGPLRTALERSSPPAVHLLGPRAHSEVLGCLPHYAGLIFPGICWEGAYPMVVREAMAHGTPVVAASGSSASDLLERHGGGAVYTSGVSGSLVAALEEVHAAGLGARRAAYNVAVDLFSRGAWLHSMNQALAVAQARHANGES